MVVHICCVFSRRGRARRAGAVLSLIAAVVGLTAALLPGANPLMAPRALVYGLAAIPARYLTWYKEAARTCPGLRWEILAAIGTIESDNGRSDARGVHWGKNRKGAEGPMQFEPATFAEYAVRADGSTRLTPYDPEDAIFTAARMLCADGGGSARTLPGAIFAYNHARWYVRAVLAIAARYTAAADGGRRPGACQIFRHHGRHGWRHGRRWRRWRRGMGWHLGHWSPHRPSPARWHSGSRWRRRGRARGGYRGCG
jgi:hypothetical protein